MQTAEFVDILRREGALLAASAEEAGPEAKVPTCPDWQVRDLLRHTGAVHRWAARFVAEGITEPRPIDTEPELDGGELLRWYRDSHRNLVDTLAAAPADAPAWTFLPVPVASALTFWARRQAHETAIHRYDAESARGGTPTPIGTRFAADGIDELLRGFHARPKSRVRTEEPRVLRVRATDTDDAVWTVRLSAEPPVAVRGDSGEAETELAGGAEQLYLALWNRVPVPSVTGDPALANLWREKSAII
ncbi:maleylpyruvate isomerase family mycothiol-dependent enzyme [Streptomyces sp. NPDC014006]|uniref:maleylpyruvate isomerase family mycothiol-dependent enzyme n=1 Tax=Streptomyces sp. NPDC014006 TaxID=3364870 RepID=UPI0036F67EF7